MGMMVGIQNRWRDTKSVQIQCALHEDPAVKHTRVLRVAPQARSGLYKVVSRCGLLQSPQEKTAHRIVHVSAAPFHILSLALASVLNSLWNLRSEICNSPTVVWKRIKVPLNCRKWFYIPLKFTDNHAYPRLVFADLMFILLASEQMVELRN